MANWSGIFRRALPRKVRRLWSSVGQLSQIQERVNEQEQRLQERLNGQEQRLKKLLKQSATFAVSEDLYPAAAPPAELSIGEKCEALIRNYALDKDDVLRAMRRDTLPLPTIRNREEYQPGSDATYWLTGYLDYLELQGLAAKHGVVGGRYFDFGGSTGRVFRHFGIQTDAWDVWSCDFKISSVDFNLRYFPTKFHSFLNTSYPSLPIPDNYFDFISGCSVFTHINETETSWLLELRRTLKIGGVACLSVHNDHTWTKMSSMLRDTVDKFRPDIAGAPTIPPGKTVVTWRDDDPYNCNTFHTDAYIRQNWGRFFEICEIVPAFGGWAAGAQAYVVCRRVD